jgi:hypothetical protein
MGEFVNVHTPLSARECIQVLRARRSTFIHSIVAALGLMLMTLRPALAVEINQTLPVSSQGFGVDRGGKCHSTPTEDQLDWHFELKKSATDNQTLTVTFQNAGPSRSVRIRARLRTTSTTTCTRTGTTRCWRRRRAGIPGSLSSRTSADPEHTHASAIFGAASRMTTASSARLTIRSG